MRSRQLDLSHPARAAHGCRTIELGAVLEQSVDRVSVEPVGSYRNLGIYSYGRGLFAKPNIEGGATSAKVLNRVHVNQFIYSRLFAFEGAYSWVAPEFDGYFVSSEFPTFTPDPDELDARWLAHYLRSPDRWAELASSSKGLGVRRQRVPVEAVLSYEVNLPPIDEQRRTANKLDRLSDGASHLARSSAHAGSLIEALGASVSARPDLSDSAKHSAGWRMTNLGSVMRQATDWVDVEPAGSYPNLGIYSFGRGLFTKPNIDGGATSAKALNRVYAGQFIYSRLFAFEGSYGFVPHELDGHFVSSEFPTFETDPERLDARWLASYVKAPVRWAELASSSKGLGVRRQRVSVESVLAYKVWLPPIEAQRAMVQIVDRLERSQRLRAQAETWMGSLVPSA